MLYILQRYRDLFWFHLRIRSKESQIGTVHRKNLNQTSNEHVPVPLYAQEKIRNISVNMNRSLRHFVVTELRLFMDFIY